MKTKGELVLLPSLKAQVGPKSRLILTQKYLNGMAEFAQHWPGNVTSLVDVNITKTSDMDHVEVDISKPDSNIEIRPSSPSQLAERLGRASAVLAFLSPFELETAKLCHSIHTPIVFTSEYSVQTEEQIIDAETRSPVLRWRRKLWLKQTEKKRLQALRLANGIQCSGSPTYEIYKRHHDHTLLFFDNRVRVSNVISEQALKDKLEFLQSNRSLRLVFGGRLIAMKGVMELTKIASSLKRLNVSFTLEIYGSGSLKDALLADIDQKNLSNEVKLRGVLDFETEWIPMLKQHADVFLCSHTQGDPSSTYPEVMSCGVPIVGFDNEAFKGIVKYSGSGWTTKMFDNLETASLISMLEKNRNEIAEAAISGRNFALQNAFEPTFTARTEHLIQASRLF